MNMKQYAEKIEKQSKALASLLKCQSADDIFKLLKKSKFAGKSGQTDVCPLAIYFENYGFYNCEVNWADTKKCEGLSLFVDDEIVFPLPQIFKQFVKRIDTLNGDSKKPYLPYASLISDFKVPEAPKKKK